MAEATTKPRSARPRNGDELELTVDSFAQGGNGVACGPPPTLGSAFQTAIAGDSAAINVAPHGAAC